MLYPIFSKDLQNVDADGLFSFLTIFYDLRILTYKIRAANHSMVEIGKSVKSSIFFKKMNCPSK